MFLNWLINYFYIYNYNILLFNKFSILNVLLSKNNNAYRIKYIIVSVKKGIKYYYNINKKHKSNVNDRHMPITYF